MPEPLDLDRPLPELLDALAAKVPAPGGGAAAALAGATAAAAAAMVVAYSVGKASLEPHRGRLTEIGDRLGVLRAEQLRLARADASAFEALSALWKRPAEDPARAEAMPGAVDAAIAAPLAMLDAAVETVRLADELGPISNPMLASDLAVAAALGESAAAAAGWNVRVNAPSLDDEQRRAELIERVQHARDLARALRESVERRCADMGVAAPPA